MRPGADVLAGIELIRTAKENPPDDWLYWLVWEYGLEELLPYLPDPRIAIERGLQWQRIRGTPASVRMALSWMAYSATIEQENPLTEHWYEYQLGLDSVPGTAQLRDTVGLARLSAPIGTRLARVYYGYDYRHGVWDNFSYSDGSLWSADSGVYDPANDVVVSFGRRTTSHAEVGAIIVGSGFRATITTHCEVNDQARWDMVDWGDASLRNYPAAMARRDTVQGQGVGRNLRVLDGAWRLDGSVRLRSGAATEAAQYPATHTSDTTPYGTTSWDSAGWGNLNWTGN